MVKKKGKLDVNIADAINNLESVMKAFRLKEIVYRILFRGKGLEFEGFRDFSPDDDANSIDWKTSARAQKLIVKQYKEERDLKIMFLMDVGSNMVFGSTDKLKCEYAAELVSAIGHLVINANDKIGFVLFGEKINTFVESKGGIKHFELFVDMITRSSNYGGKTNFNQVLDFAMEYFSKSVSAVIIVSDFLNIDVDTEKKLDLLSNRFETLLIKVKDPLDLTLPDVEGEVTLEDPNTHQQVIVNPKVARATYEKYAFEQDMLTDKMFKRTQADSLDLVTNIPFAEPLAIFLKERGNYN